MKRMKVYVLETGYLPQDKSILIAGLTQATEHNRNPKPVWTHTPTYAVLIDHPEGYVLLDTSVNPKGMTERFPESLKEMNNYVVADDATFPARLEQLHVKPADVKYIVMSHMHFDHAGNLEMFRDSEIIVHEDEFTMAMKTYALNREMGVYVWDDLDQQVKNKLHWNLFPADQEKMELMDGLTIYNLGSGHTYGMLALLVELSVSGNILMVQDAIYTKANYGPPIRQPGIIYDSLGFVKSVEKVRQIAAEKNATIWFGHDDEQFATLIKSNEGYYE